MLHRLNYSKLNGHGRLVGQIPRDKVAYVDSACLSGGYVMARLFSQETAASAAAWACLQDAANRVASRLCGNKGIYIEGTGMFAKLLESIVAQNIVEKADASVLIDTTGDGSTIEKLLSVTPRLGTMILCAHPCNSTVSVDLYAEIHSPGITVAAMDMWRDRTNILATSAERPAVSPMPVLPVKTKLGEEFPNSSLWLEVHP